jgi:nitrile hydratase subunit alpha
MAHAHEHDHPHEHAAGDGGAWSEFQYLEAAVRELLIEKGIVTAEEMRREIERMDGRNPEMGARVVARAWTDPTYKERLLREGTKAVAELGVTIDPTHLVVVENTDEVHNMVVCTLCSCYPRNLLGRPPDWYKQRDYRSRAVREPRQVLKEFGTELPDGVRVAVHDSTADMRYLVLPKRPAGTEGMSEAELAKLVTRDSMIGVSVPRA